MSAENVDIRNFKCPAKDERSGLPLCTAGRRKLLREDGRVFLGNIMPSSCLPVQQVGNSQVQLDLCRAGTSAQQAQCHSEFNKPFPPVK